MSTQRVLARDIRVGDLIVFLGGAHLVERIEPDDSRPGWRMAHGGSEWTIALDPSDVAYLDVQRAGGAR